MFFLSLGLYYLGFCVFEEKMDPYINTQIDDISAL